MTTTPQCLRCSSEKTMRYGERVFCLTCGFTFHKSSATVDDEMARRAQAAVQP